MRHPIQQVIIDDQGVPRFRANAIVAFLLERGAFDMNILAMLRFSREDREQFLQLLGHSVSGAGDFTFMSPEVIEKADIAAAQLLKDGGA